MSRLVNKVFLANGSWIAPPGVTYVILTGFGGGGAGGSGGLGSTIGANSSCGGGGGGGAQQKTQVAIVVPGTTYTIAIGAGGTAFGPQINGGDGNSTSFHDAGYSVAVFWLGAQGGMSSAATAVNATREHLGGGPIYLIDQRYFTRVDAANYTVDFRNLQPGSGGAGYNYAAVIAAAAAFSIANESPYGSSSVEGFAGGYGGVLGSGPNGGHNPGGGGGGGGAGPNGNGGTGGDGGTGNGLGGNGGAGNPGINGAANSGAGGGGGGSGGQGPTSPGVAASGGNGGSGKLTIAWIE